MAISKIVYKENSSATPVVWMDATTATAAAADITSPKTAMLADGVVTTGTGTGGGGSSGGTVWQDGEGYIHLAPEGEYTTAPEKWVNFIDYNGDILYSYTKAEIAQLEALPDNPSHSGLVSQGWNWTLAEIQAEVLAGTTKIWVGQSYVTESGATEIDVEFTDPDYLSPYLCVYLDSSNTELTVDWGDGSTPSEVIGKNDQYIQHTFPSIGRYTIKISISDNTKWYYFYNSQGNNHPSILLTGAANNDTTRCTVYSNAIKAIRIGDNFYISAYGSFRTINNVKYITIPNTIRNVSNSTDTIGGVVFSQCASLESITLPRGIVMNPNRNGIFSECNTIKNVSVPYLASIELESFYATCRSIVHPYIPSNTTIIKRNCFLYDNGICDLVLPNSLTTIEQSAFNSCQGLYEITIPASVTSIGNDAFRYNYGLLAYHFLSTTPPTLDNSTVFGGINASSKIYVPSASVNAYKTATNWSTYASYIEAEPE